MARATAEPPSPEHVGPAAPQAITAHEIQLWTTFLDAYGATTTRPAVDQFLRALIGAP
jgi:hypothetical protein